MKQVINFYSTKDEHGYMSNFAAYPIVIGDLIWKTSEAWYQAQKVDDPAYKEKIHLLKSPMAAAIEGRKPENKIREDWDRIKNSLMHFVVTEKFSQHPDIRAKLIATGDAYLCEHTTNDSYWGDGGDGSGQNMLGKILMIVRDELKD